MAAMLSPDVVLISCTKSISQLYKSYFVTVVSDLGEIFCLVEGAVQFNFFSDQSKFIILITYLLGLVTYYPVPKCCVKN